MTDSTSHDAPYEGQPIIGPYRLSWTAYVRPIVIFLIMIYVASLLGGLNPALAWIVGLIALGVLIYRILQHRSVGVYADTNGVWMRSGIFPWDKGTRGVKWRDLDQAQFFQGIHAWAFRSYEVLISHRYTQSSELRLRHLHLGHQAVTEINAHHLTKVRPDL